MKEETKKTKKFNKKYLAFGILGLFALALVTAGVIVHYKTLQQQIEVQSPIEVILGNNPLTFNNVFSNTEVSGDLITVTNLAPFAVPVKVETIENSGGNIKTSYVGTLELTKKNTVSWKPIPGETIEINYTVVGDTFEVTGVPDGYTLIYYKDNDANADDEQRLTVLGISGSVNENLPHSDDWNAGPLANYCDNEIDVGYTHCKGAKLWAVPNVNIDGSGNLIWSNPGEFYFETELIEYNKEGQITIYPTEVLDFTPVYKLGSIEGLYTVTTEVNPITA